MFKKNRILAIIPARGGSKRIPGKNIKNLSGKPLMVWTIEAALSSRYIDTIVVSSEDNAILQVAERFDVESMKRSQAASADTASADQVILEILEKYNDFDFFVYLQPTSPLRSNDDIDDAIELCISEQKNTCVSVTKSSIYPAWFYKIENQQMQKYCNLQNEVRQKMPVPYITNGAIYIAKIKEYLMDQNLIDDKTIPIEMPIERSIDIDTHFDFKVVELLLNEK